MAMYTLDNRMGDIITCCRLRKDVPEAGRRIRNRDTGAGYARIAIIGVKSHRIQDRYIIGPRRVADGSLYDQLSGGVVQGRCDRLGTRDEYSQGQQEENYF